MRIDVYTRFDVYVGSIGDADLISCVHTDELNGEDSLAVETTFPLYEGYRLVWRDEHGTNHEHVCQEPTATHSAEGTVYTDTALNSICELYGDFIEDRRPYGYDFNRALSVCLETTRWEVGTVDQPGTVSSGLTFYRTDCRTALNDILECGGELETEIEVGPAGVAARRVGIRAYRGSSSTHRRFAYEKDISSISRIQVTDAITACYGYGSSLETDSGGYTRKISFGEINGGRDYVEDLDALELYGRPDGGGGKAHVFGVYENDDCEDMEQLLEETRDYLEQNREPSVTYEADVVDLVQFGRDWEGVGVGDNVQIVDRSFDPELRATGRVSKLETDLLSGQMTVTLGNIVETLADIFAAQQAALSSISNRSSYWDAASGTSSGYLEQLIAALNERFNSQGNSYYFISEEKGSIWSTVPLDEDGNPTEAGGKAIQLSGEGFRVANGTLADMQFDWRTFGTGDGFTADEIVAGTMTADRVRAGILQDNEAANYWNLTTGELHTKNMRAEQMTAVDSTVTGAFESTGDSGSLRIEGGAMAGYNADGEEIARIDLVSTESSLEYTDDLDAAQASEGLKLVGNDLIVLDSGRTAVMGTNAATGDRYAVLTHESGAMTATAITELGYSNTYGVVRLYYETHGLSVLNGLVMNVYNSGPSAGVG